MRLKKEDDPFWDQVEDLFIGLGNMFLQNLSYRMDFEDKCYITDYKVMNFKFKRKIIEYKMNFIGSRNWYFNYKHITM